MAKKIPVVECFGPTLQGEGALAGTSSHFLRTGGCPRKCVQCDSLHAVLPERFRATASYLEPSDIVTLLAALPQAEWITFSGGDPLMWKGLGDVIQGLRGYGYKFAVETQGDLWQGWLEDLDHVTVSPKAPGMDPDMPVQFSVLQMYVDRIGHKMCFKVVIFTEDDLDLVEELLEEFPTIPMFLSTGTDILAFEAGSVIHSQESLKRDILERTDKVITWAQERNIFHKVRIFPQLHVLIWGEKQGV